jgi:hypothetical protein
MRRELMEFPILTKAKEPYTRMFPNKRFNQEVLMSAEYVFQERAFRVVGIVNKNIFGVIKDYHFIDFVVVDDKGTMIQDYSLSKRMYDCFSTLSYLYIARNHIKGSILENPAYFESILMKYDPLWESVRPVVAKYRFPEEWYRERFDGFYQFLVSGNKTNIEADPLARELQSYLRKSVERVRIDVLEVEALKVKINHFVQLTNERTLLILRNKELYETVKTVIFSCQGDKDFMKKFSDEEKLIRDIIKGCQNAIRESLINAELELKIKTIDGLITNIDEIRERGRLVDDLSDKGFKKQWLYRESLKV